MTQTQWIATIKNSKKVLKIRQKQNANDNKGKVYEIKEQECKVLELKVPKTTQTHKNTPKTHDTTSCELVYKKTLSRIGSRFYNHSRTHQEHIKNPRFEIRMQQELKLPIGTQQRTKPTNWNSRIQYRNGFLWKPNKM